MLGIFKRKKAKKFGEIAVEKGLASEKDVQEALRHQKEYEEIHQIHKVKTILEEQDRPIGLMAWFCALFRLSH